MKVTGVVVGTRKAGTTWLYENFLRDPEVSVSPLVKESRFFLGAMSPSEYDRLFTQPGLVRVEVDTALAYEDEAPRRILAYHQPMRVLLILREPVSFAVSRFIHSRRKGEIRARTITEAIETEPMFAAELDYAAIVQRFRQPGLQLTMMRFEDLARDPVDFYAKARRAVTGLESALPPSFTEKANAARRSRMPVLSWALATAAGLARKAGFHRLVTATKALGFHRVLEQAEGEPALEAMRREAEASLRARFPGALETYRALP